MGLHIFTLTVLPTHIAPASDPIPAAQPQNEVAPQLLPDLMAMPLNAWRVTKLKIQFPRAPSVVERSLMNPFKASHANLIISQS